MDLSNRTQERASNANNVITNQDPTNADVLHELPIIGEQIAELHKRSIEILSQLDCVYVFSLIVIN